MFADSRGRICQRCKGARFNARNVSPAVLRKRRLARQEQDYALVAAMLDAYWASHDVTVYQTEGR